MYCSVRGGNPWELRVPRDYHRVPNGASAFRGCTKWSHFQHPAPHAATPPFTVCTPHPHPGWPIPHLHIPTTLSQPILRHYRGYEPPAAAAERLSTYVTAATALPEVTTTMVHPKGLDYPEALIAAYKRYADGSAKSQVARDINSTQEKGRC